MGEDETLAPTARPPVDSRVGFAYWPCSYWLLASRHSSIRRLVAVECTAIDKSRSTQLWEGRCLDGMVRLRHADGGLTRARVASRWSSSRSTSKLIRQIYIYISAGPVLCTVRPHLQQQFVLWIFKLRIDRSNQSIQSSRIQSGYLTDSQT